MSELTCHWTVGAGVPMAEVVRVTDVPAATAALCGLEVMVIGVPTVSVAAEVVAVPAVLLNSARYWLPDIVVSAVKL